MYSIGRESHLSETTIELLRDLIVTLQRMINLQGSRFLQSIPKIWMPMTQPSFILLNKSLVSFASISLLVLPFQINDLRNRQDDRDDQRSQAHRVSQDVLR